jgi:SAM-dependent methyltransferase
MIDSPEGLSPFTQKELDYNNAVFATSFPDLKQKAKEYGDRDRWIYAAGANITSLLTAWKGQRDPAWSLLKGAKVLDLGSGANLMRQEGYPPHFARLCAMNGAEVVAIDVRDQSPWDLRLFDGVKADIAQLVASHRLTTLPNLDGKKFDLINSHGLVGSNPAEGMVTAILQNELILHEFEDKLKTQLEEVLNEQGVMMLGEEDRWTPNPPFYFIIYKKINGVVQKITPSA